jgi:hypothetical protein
MIRVILVLLAVLLVGSPVAWCQSHPPATQPATVQPSPINAKAVELKAKIEALKQLHSSGVIDDAQLKDSTQKLLNDFVAAGKPGVVDQPEKPISKPEFCCNYFDANVPEEIKIFTAFSEGASFETAVREILSIQGIQNFIIQPANVPNAMATSNQGNRFILYNPKFIDEMKKGGGTNWAVYSIVAHEIGHHLLNHTASGTGSRPSIEIEADEYSGFVMYKMGATLPQAQIAMSTMNNEQGSSTHPGKKDRLEAIAKGWNKAKKLDRNPPKPDDKPKDKPKPEPKPEPGPANDDPDDKPPIPSWKKKLALCVHKVECIHKVPCQHAGPCQHPMPCQHQMPCQHWVQTPYGPRQQHQYDTLHQYDLMHPADALHPFDTQHEFDLLHPEGDPAQ